MANDDTDGVPDRNDVRDGDGDTAGDDDDTEVAIEREKEDWWLFASKSNSSLSSGSSSSSWWLMLSCRLDLAMIFFIVVLSVLSCRDGSADFLLPLKRF